jgi:hypothetical protein
MLLTTTGLSGEAERCWRAEKLSSKPGEPHAASVETRGKIASVQMRFMSLAQNRG